MATDFDPYHKWLGIRPEEHPVTLYRLLGLVQFESDSEVISNAADQRVALLKSFQTGPHSQQSQQLLNEVAKATVCLLNPAKKAQYDRSLAEPAANQASHATPPPTPIDITPDLRAHFTPLVERDARTSRSRPTHRTTKRARSTGWPVAILVTSIGIAVVAVVALRERTRARRAIQNANLQVQVAPAQVIGQAKVVPPPASPKTNLPVPTADSAPPQRDPTPPTIALQSVEPDEQPRVFSFPRAVDLRPISDGQLVRIGEIADPEPTLELINPDGNPRKFEIVRSGERWNVSQSDAIVATVSRADNTLYINWTSQPRTTAECLRNALLSIKSGEDQSTVAFRDSKMLDWATVDLDKTTSLLPLDVDLYDFDARKLLFEVVSIRNGPTIARAIPENRQAAFGDKVRLIFNPDAPHVALEFSLMISPTKGTLVKLSPLMVDSNGDTRPWTTKYLGGMIRKLRQEIAEAQAGIANAPTERQRLSNAIAEYRRGINDHNRFAIQAEVATINAEIAQIDAAVSAWKSSLPGLQTRSVIAEKLGTIGESVHNKARVGLKVFYTAAGADVVVLQCPAE